MHIVLKYLVVSYNGSPRINITVNFIFNSNYILYYRVAGELAYDSLEVKGPGSMRVAFLD